MPKRLCKVLCHQCNKKKTCTEACPEIIKSIKRNEACQNLKSTFLGVIYHKPPCKEDLNEKGEKRIGTKTNI